MKDHAEKSKEKLNYSLKEANDAKLAQKEEKQQVIVLQEIMDKNPKSRNPKELRLFEYAEADRIT